KQTGARASRPLDGTRPACPSGGETPPHQRPGRPRSGRLEMLRKLVLAFLSLALAVESASAADLVRSVRYKISAGDLATGIAAVADSEEHQLVDHRRKPGAGDHDLRVRRRNAAAARNVARKAGAALLLRAGLRRLQSAGTVAHSRLAEVQIERRRDDRHNALL